MTFRRHQVGGGANLCVWGTRFQIGCWCLPFVAVHRKTCCFQNGGSRFESASPPLVLQLFSEHLSFKLQTNMLVLSTRVTISVAITVGVLFLSSVIPCASVSAQDAKRIEYKLPDDGNEVIFLYDEQNGFTPPRKSQKPVFLLRADGSIEMPSLFGRGNDIKAKISAAEVQEFLHFVVAENRFVQFDASTVQGQIEELRKKRQIPQVADLPDSVFELNIPGYSHSVRQEAVGMPSEYKEVTALQQLLTIRRGVNKLMSETRAGGKEGIKKLLGPVNQKLKEEYPDVAPLAVADFSGAYVRQDGTISATISRPGRSPDGKPNGTYVNAVVQISESSDVPSITLRVKLKP